MIIKIKNPEELLSQTNARIKLLNEKLQEAKDEDDTVAVDTLKSAIEHLKQIKRAIKADAEIYLDDDDRFVLGV